MATRASIVVVSSLALLALPGLVRAETPRGNQESTASDGTTSGCDHAQTTSCTCQGTSEKSVDDDPYAVEGERDHGNPVRRQAFTPTRDPNQDAGAPAAAFKRRVDEYVALHRRLEMPLLPLEPALEAWEIALARDRLAVSLREARREARGGEFFGGDTDVLFRKLIAQVVGDCDPAELRHALAKEGGANVSVRARVNALYPKDTTDSSMPRALLKILPPLPPELQYRFVHGDLILLDTHADLIVDVLPDALAGR